jgi:hypothetical protein
MTSNCTFDAKKSAIAGVTGFVIAFYANQNKKEIVNQEKGGEDEYFLHRL